MIAQPVSPQIALLIVLGLGLLAALLHIRTLRARGRALARAVAECERRESQRTARCAAAGHDLDEACTCTRCLTEQHVYKDIDTRRTALRTEAVNPNADPGALYLDSNFQPDYDYGLTQTVFRSETMQRCQRCGHERIVTDEYAVENER